MIERFLSLLPTFEHVRAIGYAAAFVAAFVDGLALIGLAIPGGTVIIALGLIAANGHLGLGELVLFAAAGAMLGDGVSFKWGQQSRDVVRGHARFLTSARFEKGKAFFARFGAASILFARFVSPLRPIIPFVAGLAHMPPRRFYVVNIVSAFAWAAAYLAVGYLIPP